MMNAVDLAAFIDELKIEGNREAELVTTSNKGILPDGSRHPQSGSVVHEKELADWLDSLPFK